MVAAPTLAPNTRPEPVPTRAISELLDDHAPPGSLSLSVVENPWQTDAVPEIAAGVGLTVNVICVAGHPVIL
jgi:hypothetical protein